MARTRARAETSAHEERYRTLNMGIGYTLIVPARPTRRRRSRRCPGAKVVGWIEARAAERTARRGHSARTNDAPLFNLVVDLSERSPPPLPASRSQRPAPPTNDVRVDRRDLRRRVELRSRGRYERPCARTASRSDLQRWRQRRRLSLAEGACARTRRRPLRPLRRFAPDAAGRRRAAAGAHSTLFGKAAFAGADPGGRDERLVRYYADAAGARMADASTARCSRRHGARL